MLALLAGIYALGYQASIFPTVVPRLPGRANRPAAAVEGAEIVGRAIEGPEVLPASSWGSTGKCEEPGSRALPFVLVDLVAGVGFEPTTSGL